AGGCVVGCEVAIAEIEDAEALTKAFTGAEAAFILPPSEFDPEPGYPEARREIGAVRAALESTHPNRVVCLSTIGADAEEDNLLSQRTLMEQALASLSVPVTFLRPAWFIDNAEWDVTAARDEGVIRSFLMPLDKRFAMVAAKDVGIAAAALIREHWTGVRVVELEGPARVSPNQIAEAFSTALDRPVRAEVMPHEEWQSLFLAQGIRNPVPRIRMLDGFNEGWIDFPADDANRLKGNTSAAEVIAALVSPGFSQQPG
ncbi:MAG TPA: NmrA family NAD(P)-binding protein, partial [Acetobacteraceae bacterium]|nr:NmrA family NAD(P)-binding protein [Acetobacteraceae bacterium]